ncbi:MAG TPA: ABC transporter substrate-binding protein, partial [Marinilabiliales bacterium]|nr:ABC transporter substrate-binding protein [Marinilabiliales bacterium]
MKNYFISILLFSLVIVFFVGCSNPKKSFNTLDDLQNASIGAMTGTTGEQLVFKRFPDAKVKSFDDIMDAITALKSNQLDAVITGFPAAMNVCKHNSDLQMLSEPVDYENTCIAIRKGNDELLAALNAVITELKNDGTLKDMRRRWFKKDSGPYELADIKLPETGELLKIGTSATREPFCFVDENKNVTGHDGELARRISAKLGRPIEFSDMKFSALIPALQSKKIDLIVAGMTATKERSKSVDFTESYFENSQVILVKKPTGTESAKESPANEEQSVNGNKMKTLDDIADKVVGVYEGTIHDAFVANKYPKAVIKRYNSSADMVLSLKTQKSDVALLDFISANVLLKSNPDLGILTNEVLSMPLGIGFNKNNPELREKFNRFLAASKANGVYDEMYQRWCVDDPEKAQMPEPNYSANSVELKFAVAVADLPYVAYLNGRYVGFDIELLQKFAESEGYRMKTTTMEFSSLIAAMASGKADIIADGIAITEERQKQVAFSDPYMDFKTAAIALKTNIEVDTNTGKLEKLDDIANKSVGVYAGTIHDTFVEEHYPNADIQRFNSPADIILSLKTGKTDAVFFDLVSAKVILKSNPDIGILSEDALTLPVAAGFNKNNAKLRHEFNKYLKEIKSDGTYD